MSSLKILSSKDYRRAVWKNGLGYTDQIAIYPESADLKRGDFLWRLSSARIEQASPFSPFPDHDRIIVVLRGNGLRLIHAFEPGGDEETVEVPELSPYEFPGDISSRCELISGPITDLSVFIRKAEAEAVAEAVEVVEDGTFDWVPAGRWNFLFAVEGTFEVSSPFASGIQQLSEGETLHLELEQALSEEEPVRLRATQGAGKLVIISLQA